jgi:hypothetical protein
VAIRESRRDFFIDSVRVLPIRGRSSIGCNGLPFSATKGANRFLPSKRFDRGVVDWPRTKAGIVRMYATQLLVLLKGVEFTHP